MVLPLAGLLAGTIHVLTGPDHLAAVAPLAAEGKSSAWRSGMLWGFGHTGGVWLVGLIAWFLRDAVLVEGLSAWSEGIVGFALIAIGLWGFRKLARQRIHVHPHAHDGSTHAHIHVHDRVAHDEPVAHAHTHAAAGIGILHGIAGSSHFLGVIPALGLPDRISALTYLGAFGVGSILAMTVFTMLLGGISVRFAHLGPRLHQTMLAACSLAAVCVGAWWLTL